MSDLERLKDWLNTFPGAGELAGMRIDYTDSLPGCFGVFPAGLEEAERAENLWGDVTVSCRYNFALYVVFAKAPGDDAAALVNADWVMDFQRWVQAQSVAGLAPRFGNIEQNRETIKAQNGELYEADAEGLAMYMVQLQAAFKTFYEGV